MKLIDDIKERSNKNLHMEDLEGLKMKIIWGSVILAIIVVVFFVVKDSMAKKINVELEVGERLDVGRVTVSVDADGKVAGENECIKCTLNDAPGGGKLMTIYAVKPGKATIEVKDEEGMAFAYKIKVKEKKE